MALTIDERAWQQFVFNRIRFHEDDRDLTPVMKLVIELTRKKMTPAEISEAASMPMATVYDQINKAKAAGWAL
jgi:hypothetical protein